MSRKNNATRKPRKRSATRKRRIAPAIPVVTVAMPNQPHQHDSNFRWIGGFRECLWVLLRLCVHEIFYSQLDPHYLPHLVPTRVYGGDGFVDEGDMAILARLRDGRYLLLVLEHKSYFDENAQLQLSCSALRLARHLADDGVTTEGTVPIVIGALVQHRKASGTRPKDMAGLANMTPDEAEVALTAGPIAFVDCDTIRREAIKEPPQVAAPLMMLTVGWDGREFTDRELDYVAKGVVLYPIDRKRYALWALVEYLRVPSEDLAKALKRAAGAEVAEAIMDKVYQMHQAKGKAEAFLMQARTKFRRVPTARQEQVRAASMRQLDSWMRRILTATSLDAVFDGDSNIGKRSA